MFFSNQIYQIIYLIDYIVLYQKNKLTKINQSPYYKS